MNPTNKTPSVVFLIPFAPRSVKTQWDTACAQLRQTLASIRNSTSGKFAVVVAGHEAPTFPVATDDRFHFRSLNHPLPEHPSRGVAVRLDKLAKISAAWEYAKANWKPKYVMKLDADDFVSSQLVGWLDSAGTAPGYLIKQGWIWRSEARWLIQRTETLDRICGSCLLIRSDLADQTGPFLTEVEGVVLGEANSNFAASDHYSLVPGSGISTLLSNDSHQRYAAQFAYLGHELPSLPFPAVVYRTSNVNSITRITAEARPKFKARMWLGKIRRLRLITPKLKSEFGLNAS